MSSSGYFAIGICHPKHGVNIGTLWRSARILGAHFLFTVGRRYKRQSSDTLQAPRHVPLFHYASLDELREGLPWSAPLVGVELTQDAVDIQDFTHPKRGVYLLGAEDHGLTREELGVCHQIVRLPGDNSMNVASAGTVVMFDRWQKRYRRPPCPNR